MAFYRRDAELFLPTPYCTGPWDPRAQHGGPPAALLAGAAERYGEDAASFVVTRVTVELLRPIGFVPLAVEVTPLRLGRQVQWLRAELRSEDENGSVRVVAQATVVRVARAELTLPAADQPGAPLPPLPPPPGPAGLPDFVFSFFRSEHGYHRAVEMRVAEGTWGEGPCTMWMRSRIPLIEGAPSSPLERLMVLADATNGIAPSLPVGDFTFINPDLTVHLGRPMRGEWLALAARSIPEAHGAGLVQSRLSDEEGELGRALQSLVIRAR